MLPEIALTAQMIRRLKQYFGGSVAVYHSKFNPNERVEIWNKVKSGEIKIVLGARSALFLTYPLLLLMRSMTLPINSRSPPQDTKLETPPFIMRTN